MSKFTHTIARCISFFFKTSIKLLLAFWLHERLTQKRTKTFVKREVHSQMDVFLAMVSHEIRTPLTSIRGNIQLVRKRLKGSIEKNQTTNSDLQRTLQETQQLLERVEQQINRLTRIINSFLESARISTNSMDLLFEVCEFNTLLQDVVRDSRYLPDTRVVQVHAAQETQFLIMADASRIKQVIIHYLTNAHKFSPADTVIDISLSGSEQQLYCSMQDYGQGIPTHEHKRIWDRYYRVPNIATLNGSEIGLGLGLHICRTIITQHNGTVGLESTPGQGSTFWFMLPLFEKNGENI
jgi:signal transduction histidine kinase